MTARRDYLDYLDDIIDDAAKARQFVGRMTFYGSRPIMARRLRWAGR